MPKITAIVTSGGDVLRVSIRVDGRAAAMVSRDAVDGLGLTVGRPWDDALAAAVGEWAAYEKAMKQAKNRLDRRPMSGKDLARKLRELGHPPSVTERVVARLTEVGILNDEAYARTLIHEQLARKPAGPRLLRVKLAQKGIDRAVADRVVPEETAGQDGAADATDLARRKLRSLSRYDAQTKKRRLWGLLSRRGFDPDTIKEALGRLDELREE